MGLNCKVMSIIMFNIFVVFEKWKVRKLKIPGVNYKRIERKKEKIKAIPNGIMKKV